MDTEGALKIIFWFLVIVFAGTVGIIVGGPIFAGYVLIRGWDNTSVFVKILAILAPLAGIYYLLFEPSAGGSQLETIWLIASPILTYGMLVFAYMRKDQMFNV